MKSKNVNFTDLFDPDVVGDGPTTPGYMVGGVPLKFAHIKYGTKRANVGYAEKGVDVSNKWAAKGTANYNDAVVIPFGTYSATSTESHDAGASWTLTFDPSGIYGITMTALHESAGTSGAPTSGNWHKAPAASVGNDYEIRFTATCTVENNYVGGTVTPTYTASTGWLDLTVARYAAVDTSHLLGGGAGSGSVRMNGLYKIEIRKVGGTQVVTSTASFGLEAIT